MIAVVARPDDRRAAALIERWAAREARLLTPLDLTVAGWRFVPGAPDAGVAVIGGRRVPVRDIVGVVTRLSCIEPEDLVTVAPSERGYAASEINSFLIAWLDELRCPVANRPQPGSLSGPPWTPDDWQVVAAEAGIPIAKRTAAISMGTTLAILPAPTQVVSVVGGACIGGSEAQQRDARRLAALSRVDCLAVGFYGSGTNYTFASADNWIDVADPSIAWALLEHLCRGRAAVA